MPALRRFSLRIELLESIPLIWRRVWVDDELTLARLHHIIQAAMGWESRHLHHFEIEGIVYRRPDEDDGLSQDPLEDEDEDEDEADASLAELLKTGFQFLYCYDLGDNWEHRIVVEQALKVDEPLGISIAAAGERACPPENAGGIHEYNEAIAELQANPMSPESAAFLEKTGVDFDPARFDRYAANAALCRLAWNGWDRL